MKFKQLIVASVFSVVALSVQAAFVAGMPVAQQAVVASAVECAPALALPPPASTPTTQTVCSVSCS